MHGNVNVKVKLIYVNDFVRFNLLTAVTVKITVFLYVIPCSLVGMYCFERPCCIHLHGRDDVQSVTSQKTEILKELVHLFLLVKS